MFSQQYVELSILYFQVRILSDSNKKLKLHAAESLAKLAKFKKEFPILVLGINLYKVFYTSTLLPCTSWLFVAKGPKQ